jgi:hypothetical protein
MHSDTNSPSSRALIIIPGTVNYFYNLSGHRIAEALGALGFDVEVSTLGECGGGEYDCCLLSNIWEIVYAWGDEAGGLAQIAALGDRCRVLISLAIDCVATPWYHKICDYGARAGVGPIFDLGLYDQGEFLAQEHRATYRFVFSGLTPSESRSLEAPDEDEGDAERPIPWAFVGHQTPDRAALVDRLVQAVDPRGFVYMPAPVPYTEKGSPHLNQQQFERVLRRTRYQVWCSYHRYFYMEPERFRSSLLTGGVPVKIVDSSREVPASAPLGYLMMEAADAGERLTARVFPRLRRRFRDDWRRFPTLTQEMARALRDVGIEADACSSRAA